MSRDQAGDAGAPEPREERISVWEWVAGGTGALMVLAALTFLVLEAQQPRTPPDVVVQLDSVHAGRNVYVAHFTARNEGSSPAAEVVIEGSLAGGTDTLTATATLPYLPGNSRRSGGLFFPVDPRSRGLRMRALGYETP